jgi:hypothetical protein
MILLTFAVQINQIIFFLNKAIRFQITLRNLYRHSIKMKVEIKQKGYYNEKIYFGILRGCDVRNIQF